VAAHEARWAIRVRDLRKGFDGKEVLRGIDLDIERGKINVIIGASGGGKTVLLKHLNGLMRPDSGHIWLEGEDIGAMNDRELVRVHQKVGMLFQHSALFDSMTVAENVAFPLAEHHHLSKEEVSARVHEMLRRLDIERLANRLPGQLSGGERKRVAVARALIERPEILLYDEPTTGLDPILTRNVDWMILQMAREFGVTSVVISHDMPSVFRIADRVLLLYEGRIIASGTPQEMLDAPGPELRAFLEPSGMLRRSSAPRRTDAYEIQNPACDGLLGDSRPSAAHCRLSTRSFTPLIGSVAAQSPPQELDVVHEIP
jgi:phospholipid/cholesterol/gamma-HCH transport system ATP-binding protein